MRINEPPAETRGGFRLGLCPCANAAGVQRMPSLPRSFRTKAQQQARERSEQDYDRKRRSESETRRLYGTARWQARRAAQLKAEPLCAMCLKEQPPRYTPATVADHIEPHRGDGEAFWSNPLQSLCSPHHDSVKQAEEAANRG